MPFGYIRVTSITHTGGAGGIAKIACRISNGSVSDTSGFILARKARRSTESSDMWERGQVISLDSSLACASCATTFRTAEWQQNHTPTPLPKVIHSTKTEIRTTPSTRRRLSSTKVEKNQSSFAWGVPVDFRDTGSEGDAAMTTSVRRLPANFTNQILHGDCIQIMRQMPAESVDFVLTDPPFLVNYRDRSNRAIQNDVDAAWLKPAMREAYRVLKQDRVAIMFYGWPRVDAFFKA